MVLNTTSKTRHAQSISSGGFTLIELMIVVAIIAIILTLALPVYNDYAIRTKVGEALSVAAAAKTAVSGACQENASIAAITESNTGYSLGAPTEYVAAILLSGPCTQPQITVQTQNTGTTPDPEVTLAGTLEDGHVEFVCSTNGQLHHVPKECRNVTP